MTKNIAKVGLAIGAIVVIAGGTAGILAIADKEIPPQK